MTEEDMAAIKRLAVAQTYHGPEREPAIEAYQRGIQSGELHKSIHMNFMSEVCSPMPDLAIRASLRKRISDAS